MTNSLNIEVTPADGSTVVIAGERYIVRHATPRQRRWRYDWTTQPKQEWNTDMTRSFLVVVPDRSFRANWKQSADTLPWAYRDGAPPRSLNCDIARWLEYEGRYVGFVWDTRLVSRERETGALDEAGYPVTVERLEEQTGWFHVIQGDMQDPDDLERKTRYIIAVLDEGRL